MTKMQDYQLVVKERLFFTKKWFFIKLGQWFSMVRNLNPPVISQNVWIRESHYGTSIRWILYHSLHEPILFCFRIELRDDSWSRHVTSLEVFFNCIQIYFIVFVEYYRRNQNCRVGKIFFQRVTLWFQIGLWTNLIPN